MADPYVGRAYQRGYGVGSIFQGLPGVPVPLRVRALGRRILRRGMRMGVGLATDKLLGRNMAQAARSRLKSAAVDTLRDVRRVLSPRAAAERVGRRRPRAPTRRRGRPTRVPVRKTKGKKTTTAADIFA